MGGTVHHTYGIKDIHLDSGFVNVGCKVPDWAFLISNSDSAQDRPWDQISMSGIDHPDPKVWK